MPYRPKPYSRSLVDYRRASRINYRIGARLANRVGMSFTKTKRKRQTSGRGVTFQRDQELIYRKRRMPRKRRRRWKNFIRKSVAASEKTLGSRTVVRNQQFSFAVSGVNANSEDIVGQLALYAVQNGGNEYLRDLNRICSDTDVSTSGKLIFQSGVMDATITNISSSDDQDRKDVPIELDIYEVSARRNFEKGTGDKGLLDCFAEGFLDQGLLSTTGTDTPLSLTTRGSTPWDCPQALSMYRLKIWKKTKYRLSGGQSLSYQMRDPKRHVMEKGYVGELTGSNLPGVTRWLILIAKPIVGFNVNFNGIAEIRVGVTRKYLYKLNERNEDKDALVT
ncbi:putative capsid protein [Avon-Heathcote Estuary associated circular virus 18]|nr:putative capsid protein [Avon-Heathcote Estuary associated circular virus 18]